MVVGFPGKVPPNNYSGATDRRAEDSAVFFPTQSGWLPAQLPARMPCGWSVALRGIPSTEPAWLPRVLNLLSNPSRPWHEALMEGWQGFQLGNMCTMHGRKSESVGGAAGSPGGGGQCSCMPMVAGWGGILSQARSPIGQAPGSDVTGVRARPLWFEAKTAGCRPKRGSMKRHGSAIGASEFRFHRRHASPFRSSRSR